MALIVKYKFQNVDANGNSVSLLPQFPSGVSYTKTDVVEGNITTRTVETDDLSKVTHIRFGCNSDTYVTGAWEYLTEILDINISYVTNMAHMFNGCSQLTQLDVSNWDTSSVQYMGNMFNNCSQLTQLDVSSWSTKNVTSMYSMFYGCSQLTQLDVSNWATKNVVNMTGMFHSCSKLTQLDVSNWDTSSVQYMGNMFRECSQLTRLDLSNFDTSKSTNIATMFYNCSQLTQLDVSNWDTKNVTVMNGVFYKCSKLTQLDVSNWDTSKVTDMNSMFYSCSKLTQLDVSNFDTSNVKRMTSMFKNCNKLTQLDVSNFNTSNVEDMGSMFHSCVNLTQLDVSNFNTSKVTSINGMFSNCQSLTLLDLSNFDTSNVTNMAFMFYSCTSLTLLDLSNFDTSKVTDMNGMFEDCKVKNVGLIYCSKDTIDNLANCITSPCNFYVTNKNYTSPNPLVKYVIYKQDKKPLLYYNPTTETWEKPVLKEWDSIEKHSDGKYYYHKRSGEVVLDGSENWRIRPDVTDDGVHVIFSVFTSFKYNKSSYMICDKFNPKSVGNANEAYSKGEGIAYYNYSAGSEYAIYYVISKSKLTSQDTQVFAQWLQANPITLVYQLETEEVYECTSIDLITYENETNYIVTAGAIAPVSTLKVMCNINNVVRELQQKVSNLENYIQHVMIDALNNALNE